ncbi:MAG: hypothetical protein SGJ19_12785 [Planctomycetia bacterium]|nr:hypothetical protein [Planctomycetia bacterium]
MEWQSKILRLLVLAHVCVAVACFAVPLDATGMEGLIAFTFGVACCQINSAAAWPVLAPMRWFWRVLWIVPPVLAWSWIHGYMRNGLTQWLALCTPMAAITALIAGGARLFFGYRFERLQNTAVTGAPAGSLETRQFSLLFLIILTTLAAIGCALARYFTATWKQYANELVVYISVAVLTDAALTYTWLRPKSNAWLRAALLAVVSVASVMVRGTAISGPDGLNILISTSHIAASVLTLQSMRVGGIRLVRNVRQGEASRALS